MQIYCSINIQSLDIGHLPAEYIESNNLTIAYVTQTLCSRFHNKGKLIHFFNKLWNLSCLVYHFVQF